MVLLLVKNFNRQINVFSLLNSLFISKVCGRSDSVTIKENTKNGRTIKFATAMFEFDSKSY